MIQSKAILILPLVYHLMYQCVQNVVPWIVLDVPHRHRNLGRLAVTRNHVVPQPVLHPTRQSHLYRPQLAAEQCLIVLGVRNAKLLENERVVSTLPRSASPSSRRCNVRTRYRRTRDFLTRLRKRGLKEIALHPQLSQPVQPKLVLQRSKQRSGPGMNSPSPFHIRVTTVMLSGLTVMTLYDDGRPPRDLLDTVPAVDIITPFRVCSV